MTQHDAFALADDFDEANCLDLDAPLEAKARRAYLAQALRELLEQPIAVHARGNAICVVVFGRMACINRNGAVSLALHDRGVLHDMEGSEPAVDNLPVRPTLCGIRQVAHMAVIELASRSLATRRGAPLDLRAHAARDWEMDRPRDKVFLEDAARALDAIPKARWRQIAASVPAALRLDPELRSASRWVGLGQMEAVEAYHLLRSADVRPQALGASDRMVLAHTLSAVSADGKPVTNLQASIHWFRAKLTDAGVTPLGWRLKLDSPLRYWKRLHADACYDLELTASALIIGQKLLPPSLPSLALARAAHDAAWEHEQPNLVRRVPAQIWRTLATRYATRPKPARDDVAEVLLWAATRGYGMDKSLRAAGYDTLVRHAYTHGLIAAAGSTGQPSGSVRQHIEDGAQAIELTTHHGVVQVARIMRNCLEDLWPQVEAGELRVFFGLVGHQRVVMSLERRGDGRNWSVNEVEVRGGGRAPSDVGAFAQRVCEWCNLAA